MISKKLLVILCICLLLILISCSQTGHGQKTGNEIVSMSDTTSDTSSHVISTADPIDSTSAKETVPTQAPETTFNPTIHYVPENKWSGLETNAYDGRDPAVWGYVASHPEGTPDPKPSRQGVGSVSYDINNISARTEKEQYSLQNDATIIVTASYSENGLFDEIYYDYHANLERWNGTEWERMLYVPESLLLSFAHYQVIERGKTITKGIQLPSVVTKLVPGKYRAILYFGYFDYHPVYAEFELTE